MPFIVSTTYETWTEEDVEIGEASDRGFLATDVPHTFEELLELLKDVRPSCYPLPYYDDVSEHMLWYTERDCEQDIETGERTIHSHHPRDLRSAQAMWLAFKQAELLHARPSG